MTDGDDAKGPAETEALSSASSPLVFISHDARDAELADAFSKLLKSVSAGMIKTFHSSDKKGAEGIDFGEEWYKRLMSTLQNTSDVICLFTERSVDRPWILFEAGVAKGKLNTSVGGVALGIPLSRVSAGPFYQFQNMDDSETDLTRLINQLAKRIPGLELDADVVRTQVKGFKESETAILKKLGGPVGGKTGAEVAEDPIAKLAEEMKSLPSRVAERLADLDESPFRRRRNRRFHPMMLEDLFHMAGEPGDPVGILMAASMVRDEVPWMYELAMEAYRASKSGDSNLVRKEINRISRISEMMMRGPIDEFGMDKEAYILSREFPRMLRNMLAHVPTKAEKPALRRIARPKSSDANKA
jgi:hypothetical protein